VTVRIALVRMRNRQHELSNPVGGGGDGIFFIPGGDKHRLLTAMARMQDINDIQLCKTMLSGSSEYSALGLERSCIVFQVQSRQTEHYNQGRSARGCAHSTCNIRLS